MVNYHENWHKITLNKVAKYHKIGIKTLTNKIAKYHTIGIKNQTKHNCKVSQDWHQNSN